MFTKKKPRAMAHFWKHEGGKGQKSHYLNEAPNTFRKAAAPAQEAFSGFIHHQDASLITC